jgi:hypothetical protein
MINMRESHWITTRWTKTDIDGKTLSFRFQMESNLVLAGTATMNWINHHDGRVGIEIEAAKPNQLPLANESIVVSLRQEWVDRLKTADSSNVDFVCIDDGNTP